MTTDFERAMKLEVKANSYFLGWYCGKDGDRNLTWKFIPTNDLFFMYNPAQKTWAPYLYDELPVHVVQEALGEKTARTEMEYWTPWSTMAFNQFDPDDDANGPNDHWRELASMKWYYCTGTGGKPEFIFKVGNNLALSWAGNPRGTECVVLEGESLEEHQADVVSAGYWFDIAEWLDKVLS
ncbi:hypothetical protein SEA_KEELAN_47 [Gordonia phage Keelan]|nr:hypothetical protein SEA_KEELAN_47 [Gordonia phage Keelan]